MQSTHGSRSTPTTRQRSISAMRSLDRAPRPPCRRSRLKNSIWEWIRSARSTWIPTSRQTRVAHIRAPRSPAEGRKFGGPPPKPGRRCSILPPSGWTHRWPTSACPAGLCHRRARPRGRSPTANSSAIGSSIWRFTGNAPVKSPSDYRIVATDVPRKDTPSKVDGTYVYVQHLRKPRMLHGRIVRPRGQSAYGFGAPVVSLDENSISDIPRRTCHPAERLRWRRRRERMGCRAGRTATRRHVGHHAVASRH